ncbi:hypothetical protein Goshw_016584 [Gossypium schwendimanii]|uniref:RNase H type-1 domain-containing protein n=1 Tax=Gossypium schwendimanii TaxID=34291 RepID=A0A7J9KST9_GOSSC|nr:hypothetical protein [Gossypium schwendimanii]
MKVNDVNEVGCGHYGGEGFRRNEPIYSCDVSRLQVVDNMVNASAQVGGVVKELMRQWGYVGTHGVLRTLLRYVLVLPSAVYDGIQFLKGSRWFCPVKCKHSRNKVNEAVIHWAPPPIGWSKFNVTGVAKEDKAGCSGVLRDEEGVGRSLFSRPIDAVVSETTEACVIKGEFRWAMCLPAISVKIAVANLLIGIDRCINQLVSIHFTLVYRQGNSMAAAAGSIYAGVGSVLRNHEGLVRGVFYRQFAALNPAKVELMVVSIVLLLGLARHILLLRLIL